MSTLGSLRIKVFGMLLLLFVMVSGLLSYLSWGVQISQSNHHLQQQVAQLQTRADGFFRQSEHYVSVAPRDFPDYFRDVSVFYPDFIANLKDVERLVVELQDRYMHLDEGDIQDVLGLSIRDISLDEKVTRLTGNWQSFYLGLQDKLGDDLEEPRLEWGTEYIRDNQDKVHEAMTLLIGELRQQLQVQSQRLEQIGNIGLIVLAVFSLLVLAWFYLAVVSRITQSIKGCVRVSGGDFGYQMKTRGNDEISSLGHAINRLSAKARLSMTLQQRLRESVSSDQAMQSVWDESQRVFDLVWLGLYVFDEERQALRIQQAQPAVVPSVLKRQHIRHQRVLDPVIYKDEVVAISDLGSHLEVEPETRIVRDMLLAYKEGESVLFMPLLAENGARYVLAMASSRANAFEDDNIALLRNMQSLLEHSLLPMSDNSVAA